MSAQACRHQPDWAALRLLDQYRLLILLGLAALFYLPTGEHALGRAHPRLFIAAHASWFLMTLSFIVQSFTRRLAIETHLFIQNYLDIVFISVLIFCSGGMASSIGSSLGALLLINMVLFSHLSSVGHALLFAGMASAFLLCESLLSAMGAEPVAIGENAAQVLLYSGGLNTQPDLAAVTVLAVLLFLTAWLITVPLRHLLGRQHVPASHTRSVLDIRQLTQLNDEVVNELDSGVVVVDRCGSIILMNDTARRLLNAEFVTLPASLSRVNNELRYHLDRFEREQSQPNPQINIEDSAQTLMPRFSLLGSGSILVCLDEQSSIQQQYRQSKLASFGHHAISFAEDAVDKTALIETNLQDLHSATAQTRDAPNGRHINHSLYLARSLHYFARHLMILSPDHKPEKTPIKPDQWAQQFENIFRSVQDPASFTLETTTQPCPLNTDSRYLDTVVWALFEHALTQTSDTPVSLSLSCFANSREQITFRLEHDARPLNDLEKAHLTGTTNTAHTDTQSLRLIAAGQLCAKIGAHIEYLSTKQNNCFDIVLPCDAHPG